MARSEVWLGPLGPFIFDNSDVYEHENSQFTGKTRRGMATEQIRVFRDPQSDDEVVRSDDARLRVVPPAIEFTIEGGIGVRLINETGAFSVPGTIVAVSSSGSEGVTTHENGQQALGVVYDAVDVGEAVLVVVAGVADVLVVGTARPGDVVCCSSSAGFGAVSEFPGGTDNIGLALMSSSGGKVRVVLRLEAFAAASELEQVFSDNDLVLGDDGRVVWGA